MLRFVPVLLLSATAALAQVPTHIVPRGAAIALGGTNNNIPFSWTPTHYQQVIDRTSVSNPNPTAWTSMRLRMASGFTNRAGQTVDIEIYLAECPNTAATASPTFASNISTGTEVNVFQRRQVLYPQVPSNDWAIAPFPFDNPFVYSALANLSLRVIVWGNSNGNQLFTYPLDAWSGSGASSIQFGTGCRAANGTATATHTLSATGLVPGGTASYIGGSGIAAGGTPALLAIGGSNTSFFGIPLPLDLTSAGAPGCSIYTDWLILVSGVTVGASVTIPVPLPNDNALIFSVHYSQYLFVDLAANALGVFTSPARSNVIGDPAGQGMARIYAAGNPNATSGTIGANYGLALGFN